MNWFNRTFKLDRAVAAQENEALFTPLRYGQRRKSFPMYATAFGWGFLVTGLAAGQQLVGLTWSQMWQVTIIGNLVLVVIAGLCAVPGQQLGMGNSPIYKYVFGKNGFFFPAIILTIAVIGWQGATIGMLASTWTGGQVTGGIYMIAAVIVGIIGLLLTYFGIGVIEKLAIVATFILVILGVVSLVICINDAGGYNEFVERANRMSNNNQTVMQGITKIVGAWCAGSIICAEISRFAKSRFVASTMMIIGLPLCQIFLNVLGYCGGVSFGTYDFTIYMAQFGVLVYIIALIGMTFALLSSLDTNLYFPAALFSFMTNMPRKGGVVICGLLGLIVAVFELFAHYGSFLTIMGMFIPALAGPIIANYFILGKGRWDPKLLHKMPKVNWASIIGYVVGVVIQFITPLAVVPAEIQALIIAIIATLIADAIFKALGHPQGYEKIKNMAVEPVMPKEDDANLGDFERNFIKYDDE